MLPQIHWDDGLFLQPHHFQRLQRGFNEMFFEARRMAWPYPYGVVEMGIAKDDLAVKKVRLTRLRAIMPQSGVEVNFGDGDPERNNTEIGFLDISNAFEKHTRGFTVCVAVPRWTDRAANLVASATNRDSVNRIYWTSTKSVLDENSGERKCELKVRLLNARLVVEAEAGQGQQDLETLPLLRVVRATGDRPALGRDARSGVPELDPNFVPACFVLAASPLLGEWVRGLFNQIDAERRARLSELTRDGRLRWENLRGQFEQVLRLRTLNRFMSRLNSLIDAPKLPPFFMYLELSGLLGELSALQPQIASDLNPLPYDHDRLNVCFADLRAKILRALRGPEPPILLEAPFATSEGVLKAELTDDQLDRPTAYYLGVRTRMPADDRDELARSVRDHDQLKVMPPTEVWEPEYGITLGPESFSLPPKEDTAYFPLCRDLSPEKWKKIVTERAAALWLAPNFKWRDADFCLLMTLPTGDQTEQRLP